MGKKVKDTSKKDKQLDPKEIAKALGAEIVDEKDMTPRQRWLAESAKQKIPVPLKPAPEEMTPPQQLRMAVANVKRLSVAILNVLEKLARRAKQFGRKLLCRKKK